MTATTAERASWARDSAGVRVMRELAVVRVSGDDARTWLNGQVTNDVRSTKTGDAVYALAINVKGRVLADVHVVDRGDAGLAMIVPRDRWEALSAHLEHHVIMEDVSLSLEPLAVLAVSGPRAAEITEEEEAYRCDRLGHGGRDVLVAEAEQERMRARLSERAARAGGGELDDAAWELARLRAGRPRFGADFGERTYPQEAGLEASAVSFKKGCYLGQEVVCMLESRGQLTRRLVRLAAHDALAAGAPITDASGTAIGEVTSAMADPSTGEVLALGFVKRAHASAGTTVRAGSAEARVLGVVGA